MIFHWNICDLKSIFFKSPIEFRCISSHRFFFACIVMYFLCSFSFSKKNLQSLSASILFIGMNLWSKKKERRIFQLYGLLIYQVILLYKQQLGYWWSLFEFNRFRVKSRMNRLRPLSGFMQQKRPKPRDAIGRFQTKFILRCTVGSMASWRLLSSDERSSAKNERKEFEWEKNDQDICCVPDGE